MQRLLFRHDICAMKEPGTGTDSGNIFCYGSLMFRHFGRA